MMFQALFLLSAVTLAAGKSGEALEHTGKPVVMDCKKKFVSVEFAAYGIYSSDNSFGLQGSCDPASSSTQKVKDLCEGRNKCEVQASNSVFGDPCVGIRKYLIVKWKCQSYKKGESLEHTGKPVVMDCKKKFVSVEFAAYGIHSGDNSFGLQGSCNPAPSSTQKVIDLCQGKKKCEVQASNSVFGDPCVGIRKYLFVLWKCVKKPVFAGTACEHSGKALTMDCGSRSIDVIFAAYGLHSNVNSCGLKGSCKPAASSLQKVKSLCQGKSQCSVQATNSIFGDPCSGIRKYLYAKWRCTS